MSLKIIYGRAGSGKTDKCFDEIEDTLKVCKSKPVLLIVPEQFSYRAEKKLTERLGATGAAGAEVITFSRLAKRIFEYCKTAKSYITPAGKAMLTYKAIADNKSRLSIFASACERQGFVDKISALISEFKRYGISPSDLNDNVKTKNAIFRSKLNDIKLIYETFNRLTQIGYSDPDDNLFLAALALIKSDFLDGSFIWIEDFSDFLPHHYALIEVLLKKADKLTVSLCCDKNKDIDGCFCAATKTFYRFEGLAKECGVLIDKHIYLEGDKKNKSKELVHLESAYTDYLAAEYNKKTEDIVIFEATNPYFEICEAAKRALYLIRVKGYRRRDIAFVFADYDSYLYMAEVVLPRYNIKFYADKKITADAHPVAHVIISVFEIFDKNWSYESVLRYLKLGYSDLSQEQIDILENYVLSAGIRGRAWRDDECWEFKSSITGEQNNQYIEKIDEYRRKAAAPLLRFKEKMGKRRSVMEMCQGLFELLEELKIREKMLKVAERLQKEGELELSQQYKRTWNIIMEVLDQMVLLMGEDKIGFDRFKDLFEAGLCKYNIGMIPQSVDATVLCDSERARTLDVKAMFILGANSGYFPDTQESEGLLSDFERTELSSLGLNIAPTQRTKAFEGQFNTYKVVTMPKKYLQISYSMSDLEGKPLMPSQTVANIRRVFPDITIKDDLYDINKDYCDLVSAPDATFDIAALMLRQKCDTKKVHEVWDSVFDWYKGSSDYKDAFERLENTLLYSKSAIPLNKDIVKQLYGGNLYTSVSRLESYAKCPFSYFIKFALKAKERKILRLEAPDVGVIMHKVLELYLNEVKNQGLSLNEVDFELCSSIVGKISDELLDKSFKGTTLMGKRIEFLGQRLKKNLIWFAYVLTQHIRAGNFEVMSCEVKFGIDGEFEPLNIDIPGMGSVKLNGIIDRLDTLKTKDGTYYRIVDYKSGSKSFSLDGLFNGLDLQLMVYMTAVKKDDMIPAGTLYYRISEPKVDSNSPLTTEDAERLLKKELKLDGLVLKDTAIAYKMGLMTEDGAPILPVSIKKDGSFYKTSSVATLKQFEMLSGHVIKCIKSIGKEILSGRIDIHPVKYKKNTPCSYCKYKAVCNFSPSEGDKYNLKPSYKTEDIWQKLNRAYGGDNDELDKRSVIRN